MMENKKVRITKAMVYGDIAALLEGKAVKYGTTVPTALDFIARVVEMLAKKNSTKSGKPTATQRENEKLKERIVAFLMEQDKPCKCGDVWKGIAEMQEYHPNKTAALLKQLVDAGAVVKQVEKNTALFSVVG